MFGQVFYLARLDRIVWGATVVHSCGELRVRIWSCVYELSLFIMLFAKIFLKRFIGIEVDSMAFIYLSYCPIATHY